MSNVTWNELEAVLQDTLQAVADGKIIFNPNGQKLQALGLVDMMPENLTLYPGRDFRLTPAGRECLASALTGETLAGHGVETPTDDLAALQVENARLKVRIEAMREMHKHTEGVYDMQYRLERENSMMLFHALNKVAPDTMKGLKLNQANTELDKVYLEYSRRLERLSMALVNVRDAVTLEECQDAARKALGGE